MKKIILAVFVLIPVTFLTGCIIQTGNSPGYAYSPGYNGSYVSSTGYSTADYGLGFGTYYSPGSSYRYNLIDIGDLD